MRRRLQTTLHALLSFVRKQTHIVGTNSTNSAVDAGGNNTSLLTEIHCKIFLKKKTERIYLLRDWSFIIGGGVPGRNFAKFEKFS